MTDIPARLIVRYGPSLENVYALTHDTTNLGREPFNDIVLNVPEMSRRHARIIRREDGRYVLEDLNSTNGSAVNGHRIVEPVELHDGDEIDLAEAIGFTFVLGEGAPTVALEPPAGRRADERPTAAYLPRFADEDEEPVPPRRTRQPAYDYGYEERLSEPLVAAADEEPERRGCGRWLLGCLLLGLILAVACAATLFFLDWYRPNLLYCGPMEPVVQFLADVLTILGFGPYQAVNCPL